MVGCSEPHANRPCQCGRAENVTRFVWSLIACFRRRVLRKTQALACSATTRLITVSAEGWFLIHSRHEQIFAHARVDEAIDVDIFIIIVVAIKLRCNVFGFGRLLRYRHSQQSLVAAGGGNDRRFLPGGGDCCLWRRFLLNRFSWRLRGPNDQLPGFRGGAGGACLLYTSPSPRDRG